MMVTFILKFARNTLVQKLLTANGLRLFNDHSKCLLFPLMHFKSIPGASRSISTSNRREDIAKPKTPPNQKFIAFNEKVNSEEHDFTMTFSEWEKLEQDILEESAEFASYIDYSIMKSLSRKPDLSVSYYNYIKSKREPNISTMVELIVNGAGKYDDLVFEVLEKIKNTYDPVYFEVIGSKVAFGISKTKKYTLAVDYLDYVCMDSEIPGFAIKTLVQIFKTSLKRQDYKTFVEVFNKYLPLLRKQHIPEMQTFSRTFFECWKDGVIPADLLFEILKLEELPLEEDLANQLETYCNSEWAHCENAKPSRIQAKRRMCYFCNEIIPVTEAIDEAVMIKMFQEVLTKMLKDYNFTISNTSHELQKLRRIIKKQEQPFDYVIDAANVGPFHLNPILKKLKNRGKHVLVICKNKMHTLDKELGTFLILKKWTHDDIYMLLASFLSGWNCYLVTNDDFSDHFMKADRALRPYFYLWRDKRRVFHVQDKLLHPPEYKWTAHESNTAWHIPYLKEVKIDEENKEVSTLLQQFNAQMFLCVMKSNYVPSPELLLLRQTFESFQEQSKKLSDCNDNFSKLF